MGELELGKSVETEPADPHPDAKVHDPKAPPVLAVLQTRCMCQRVLQVPNNPPPKTVTVDLAPLKGGPADEKRVFYLAGEGATDSGEKLLVYREGPALEPPRIIVPGVMPPKDMRRLP